MHTLTPDEHASFCFTVGRGQSKKGGTGKTLIEKHLHQEPSCCEATANPGTTVQLVIYDNCKNDNRPTSFST